MLSSVSVLSLKSYIGLNDMCTLVKSCLFSLFSPLQGLILIMAPRRGRTLDAFLELCQGKFDIYLDEEFDGDVTLSHQKVITVTQNISRAQQLIPFYFVYTYRHFLKKIRRVIFIYFYFSTEVA